MTSQEIRQRFLNFFEKREHKIIPSASLVPENDPSVLFTTAGMQPLAPYLLGEKHPVGNRLTSAQKCVRTGDIDEVGDNTHLTFFEMLGNWSLGDYFKKDAITWSWELLTDPDDGFGLDPKRLYVTCFEGDENAERDEESAKIWRSLFEEAGLNPDEKIFFLGADKNWWSPGDSGPCGPDTEMYYDVSPEGIEIKKLDDFKQADSDQKIVEIWNDVFMEYEKRDGKIIGKLQQKNVDTGAGLERLTTVIQKKSGVFETDMFDWTLATIREMAGSSNQKATRIVADHLRTATFMLADGVTPSNTDRGYVLRRLIRRAIRFGRLLRLPEGFTTIIAESVVKEYEEVYPELKSHLTTILSELKLEEKKFGKTVEKGLKEFERGQDPFDLYQSYGFPIELTEELAKEAGITIDRAAFDTKLREHQDLSRSGAEQKFKGGLGGTSDQIIKYHTATHLLQQALVDVLGSGTEQRGSNITDERLRFDFTCDHKLTDEEKAEIELIVNEKIEADIPVQQTILSKTEAEASGARHLFNEKYGDQVSVFFVGESLGAAYSKEFCGGPHVKKTGELGRFKIAKEEAVAAGIRRIKAVLN